ncbi:MAG TPA: hypothetical protein VK631_25175 [Solirubrobacteraceae bacterium]|nr:hypothetical protein [Solirubrobacteraceae bacterium]
MSLKRPDLVATYESARNARRAYEVTKTAAVQSDGQLLAWQRGWKDEGRVSDPSLTWGRSETTP